MLGRYVNLSIFLDYIIFFLLLRKNLPTPHLLFDHFIVYSLMERSSRMSNCLFVRETAKKSVFF